MINGGYGVFRAAYNAVIMRKARERLTQFCPTLGLFLAPPWGNWLQGYWSYLEQV